MALLKDDELKGVVELFQRREVNFYHACQLKDFKTYIELGGVPSRNLLESSGLPYTNFQTDAVDRANGVWTKVFGNLGDFGFGFGIGKWRQDAAPTPNPYGPILLVAKPSILLESLDTAICLRSAGGQKFDRETESLKTVEEVDRLFEHKINAAPNQQSKSYIKYSGELRKEFGNRPSEHNETPTTYNPEVSCTVEFEFLSFKHLDFVLVDKYWINQNRLISIVAKLGCNASLNREIRERQYLDNRHEILCDLANMSETEPCTLSQITTSNNVSSPTRDWAQRLITSGLEWQYKRFIKYLYDGTFIELRKISPSEP